MKTIKHLITLALVVVLTAAVTNVYGQTMDADANTDATSVVILPLPISHQAIVIATDEVRVWPAGFEQARIKYLGAVSTRVNKKKRGFMSRLKKTLVGEDQLGEVAMVKRPFDSFVDSSGRFFITNGQSQITVFDPVTGEGKELDLQGSASISKPMGISGDRNDNIYIADAAQRRIIVFDAQGDFVKSLGGPEILRNPIDVAVTADAKRVYVVDSYLHQVVVFDPYGNVIQRIGRDKDNLKEKLERIEKFEKEHPGEAGENSDLFMNRSNELGEFHYPAFVALASDGTVYVTDGMNFRIQAFDRNGKFLRTFGRQGRTPGSFARPKDIATDQYGHVYVVDAIFNNVQIFNAQGELLLAFGENGKGAGELWSPIGISVDRWNRIHIADRFNNRIQVYQYIHVIQNQSAQTAAQKIN